MYGSECRPNLEETHPTNRQLAYLFDLLVVNFFFIFSFVRNEIVPADRPIISVANSFNFVQMLIGTATDFHLPDPFVVLPNNDEVGEKPGNPQNPGTYLIFFAIRLSGLELMWEIKTTIRLLKLASQWQGGGLCEPL